MPMLFPLPMSMPMLNAYAVQYAVGLDGEQYAVHGTHARSR
jgi:hypothetical protein